MTSMRAAVNNSKKSKSSTIYTTIAFYIKFAFLGNYALVFWEEENSVSVLCGEDVRPHAEIGSQPHSTVDVGSLCNVTMNASVYKGKVAAKGTTMYIDLMLGEVFCHFYCVERSVEYHVYCVEKHVYCVEKHVYCVERHVYCVEKHVYCVEKHVYCVKRHVYCVEKHVYCVEKHVSV